MSRIIELPDSTYHTLTDEELERGEAMMAHLREVEAALFDDTGQTTNSRQLLPCPFCGGRAWIQYWPYPDGMGYEARVVCGGCHVSTSRDFESGRTTYLLTGEDITRLLAIEKAIQTWNRRA